MELILASNSPRRKELLQSKGLDFKVISSNYNEEYFSSDPVQTAVQFALGKASDVFQSLQNKDGIIVLGADTVVFHEGKILGKAPNDSIAKKMLKSLSGKTHSVITGYALISKEKTITGFSESSVKFNDLSEGIIDDYIASGLYKGKAGSYGIQDGFPLVESFTGDYNNIVGLPVDEIIFKLKEMV
jgi:septum formation protein